MRLRLIPLILVASVLVSGCGSDGTGTAVSPVATGTAVSPAAGTAPADRTSPSAAPRASTGLGAAPARLPALPAGAVLVGKGSAAGCTQDALRAALRTVQQRGRGTVGFDCGDRPVTIAITRPLVIEGGGSSAYVVDGRGTVTLDGRKRSGLFVLPDAEGLTMTFRRLRMVDARSRTQGAAVHGGWRNRLLIEDCTFLGNATTSAATTFDGGGAVYVHEGSATIRRSTFERNTAGNGGAVQNTIGALTVEDSVFRRNRSTVRGSGGGGGAVYSDAGSLTMRRSQVLGNTAQLQGGGLFLFNARDRRTRIEDSTIADNRVTDAPNAFGGGIRSGSGPVELVRSRVLRNRSAGQGGGLYNADDARVTVTGCTFTGNRAEQGGAVFKVSGEVKIDRTTFSGNSPANVL
jgi:hypothetical protein